MKVLLVDDEPIMLLAMKRMLSSIEGVELVGSFQQVEEAFVFLCNHDVDLAFLDIQIGSDDEISLPVNCDSIILNLILSLQLHIQIMRCEHTMSTH